MKDHATIRQSLYLNRQFETQFYLYFFLFVDLFLLLSDFNFTKGGKLLRKKLQSQ